MSDEDQRMGAKLLYLHGSGSGPNAYKAEFLRSCGYDLVAPDLRKRTIAESIDEARRALAEHQPKVIVGSSRGGAVALAMKQDGLPMVLIAPAWILLMRLPPQTESRSIILHSQRDFRVPWVCSWFLLRSGRLPNGELWTIGQDHRLNDPESQGKLHDAIERMLALQQQPAEGEV